MSTLDRIKDKVKARFEIDPNVHVNVCLTHPKLHLENDEAVIKGVYPHVFRLEEYSTGNPQCHTLQYTDILINRIQIIELNED